MKPTDTPDPTLVARLQEHEKQATRLSYLESTASAVYDTLSALLIGDEKRALITAAERLALEAASHNANVALRSINARVVAHSKASPR